MTPPITLSVVDLVIIATVLWILLNEVHKWWRRRKRPEPGTTEYVHHLYKNEGVIDEAEMERRLDVLEDPAADRIREVVERVNGVGTSTSFAIAARFDSLRDLREASRAELEAVPNVGPDRARAIQEQV